MTNGIQFLLYNLPEEEGRVQVIIKDETIWCTQKAMAQLFGIDKSGISRHITNIFKDGELQPDMTVAKIATVVNASAAPPTTSAAMEAAPFPPRNRRW